MSGEKLVLRAPAKVNLTLAVGKRREDGYHEICSVMQKIALFDTLTFTRADQIRLHTNLGYLPTDRRNLCVRAAELYFASAGIRGGVEIGVRKIIPVGAGLAGGSTDAAVTLRALERMYRKLPEKTLYSIARTLGADVPFCLSPDAACLCEGVGEVLTPIKEGFSEKPYLLLVKNDRKLSTADVYRTFDSLPSPARREDAPLFAALARGDAAALAAALYNDLEPAVFSGKPQIALLLDRMTEAGALGARMSGAGPTVYGVFATREAALAAARSFSDADFCRAVPLL